MLTINELIDRLQELDDVESMPSDRSFYDDEVLAYLMDPENAPKTAQETISKAHLGHPSLKG